MKKTMLVATFLAVGAGSAGVSALSNIKMAGSDTLKDFTLTVITAAACPASVGITYIGGGSGAGENALIASILTPPATQSTAPMSRFLAGTAAGGVCQVDTSKAEGIAYAADGLAIALSRTHLACDPHSASGSSPNPDCNPNATTPKTGIRNSGTLTTGYVLGDGTSVIPGWRDVLRQVFLGLPKTAGKDPATPTSAANNNRNCASAERVELVNHWGELFETGCTTGNCTQLNHAWRRDLLSGTTDVFRELINAKLYPFCNLRFPFDPQPTLPTSPPTKLALYPNPLVLSTGAPIFEDPYQDFDPIRRACVGGADGQGASLPDPNFATNPPTQPDFPVAVAEQVCGPQGNLGVVLPVRPPVFTGQTVDQLYPNKPCLLGNLIFGTAPKIPGTSNSTLCPNGDVTFGNQASDYNPATGLINNSSDTCLIPAQQPSVGNDDARCINGANNFNSPIDPPAVGNIPGNRVDGRVFNLHQYNQFGGYRLDSELGPSRNVVGNFSRIHSTRTLVATAPSCPGTGSDKRCCSQDDATSQIGCLTEADQCSFGFAGGESSAQVLATTAGNELAFAASINNIKYDQTCIVSAQYPLARKVYFNTLIGFENVTGQELALAKCFAGGATGFASLLAAKNLFPLPTGPVCQDFPNEGCSSNNTAGNACTGNAAVGLPE